MFSFCPGYNDNYPTYRETHAKLGIYHRHPDEVSQALGLVPSRTQIRFEAEDPVNPSSSAGSEP